MTPTPLLQKTSTVDISRYFQNPYHNGDNWLRNTTPPLTMDECVGHAAALWNKCQAYYNKNDSTKKKRKMSTSYYGSLYQGALGAQVFVLWKFAAVHRQRGEENASKQKLETALRNVEEALRHLGHAEPGGSSSTATTTPKSPQSYHKRVTLLESPWVGARVLQIAIWHDLDPASEKPVVEASKFCDELARVCQEQLTVYDNEVLYGRAGAIQAILFLRQCLGNHTIGRAASLSLARHIIVAGQRCAAQHAHDRLPLLWEWHHSKYLGAAHGVAGILHTLLSLESLEELAVLDKEFGVHALIQSTLEGMQTYYCWPSGNLDSSIKISHQVDRLVHWCHGATGHILLLRKAYEVYGDVAYKESATRLAQNVVWQRGLLLKGVGLCHGISGNAYALLAAARDNDDCSSTSDVTERHAHAFARFALDNLDYLESIPDDPYSLFNGVAGLCTLFLDLAMSGRQARFPLYDHVYS